MASSMMLWRPACIFNLHATLLTHAPSPVNAALAACVQLANAQQRLRNAMSAWEKAAGGDAPSPAASANAAS